MCVVVLITFSPLCMRVAMRIQRDIWYMFQANQTQARRGTREESAYTDTLAYNADARAGRSSYTTRVHPTGLPELLPNDLIGLDEFSNASVDANRFSFCEVCFSIALAKTFGCTCTV